MSHCVGCGTAADGWSRLLSILIVRRKRHAISIRVGRAGLVAGAARAPPCQVDSQGAVFVVGEGQVVQCGEHRAYLQGHDHGLGLAGAGNDNPGRVGDAELV